MEPASPGTTLGRRRIAGAAALRAALDAGDPVRVVLLRRDAGASSRSLADRARRAGARVLPTTAAELRRLADTADPVDVLAMSGDDPAVPFDVAVRRPGAAWLLAGLRYPGNVGFALRTAEVTGAAAVAVGTPFGAGDRKRALRASMGADRFLPVAWTSAAEAIATARAAGRRVLAVEDADGPAPWEEDLVAPVLLVLGSEREGLAPDVLALCDGAVRVPMRGVIPALNVHAAMAAVAVERLRQEAGGGGRETERTGA